MPGIRYLQQKQVWSQMPLPSTLFGVTAKQILVLVTVGCLAAYFFNTHDEHAPENLALEAFIRSQEQVGEQVGAVLGITLIRQVEAYPAYDRSGYKRSMYAVEGERGQLVVTLKQGEQGIEVTEIRSP
jgi:hypothetical protein